MCKTTATKKRYRVSSLKKELSPHSVKFGVPLAEIDQGREIPLFVLKCTSFLETHALRTEAIFFYENADHIASLSAMLEKGQTELTAIQVM